MNEAPAGFVTLRGFQPRRTSTNLDHRADLSDSERQRGEVEGEARSCLLDSRSLHFADHRFALICSGRDDRTKEI